MSKLCLIFFHPSHYREPIYRLIENEYDCEWHFADSNVGVDRFDLNILKNVHLHKLRKIRRLDWIVGINNLLGKKDNNTFLMRVGSIDLSCWLFFLRAKLFYPKKRVYLWGHAWYGKESKLEAFIKRLLFKSVTGIFVYGNYAKELIVQQGIPADRVFVIHNSLNYDAQLALRNSISSDKPIFKDHFHNDNPNLIFIGRLTEVKKLDQLINAMALSKAKGRNYNLTFVGDGPMKESLMAITKEAGLDNQVWFYGASYDERTNAELIYNADLCVAPGNIGLTAMHCMMFGTPALSHNDFKWQMPEFEAIIPDKTGGFFIRDSVDDISAKIDEWFKKNSNNRETVRQNCYDVIDKEWNPHYQISILKSTIQFEK